MLAVVMIEGFDHINASVAAQIIGKGWSSGWSAAVAGRFDGQAFQIFGNSGTVRSKLLPSTYSTLFCGFAFQLNGASGTAGTNWFEMFSGGGATVQMGLSCAVGGQIQVKNNGGTVIATGSTVLVQDTWYYCEVELVIAGASGTVQVNLNGSTEISSTVGNFGSSNIDTVGWARPRTTTGGTAVLTVDDIYVCDNTGSAPRNTFLGDVRVETIYPTSDGTHLQWTPTGGGTHFSQVDDPQPDDDATYVSDATPGDMDTYHFGTIDGGATVFGLQTNFYARKDDANLRQIASVVRQGGVDNIGATITLGSNYLTYSTLYNQDPTSANWTPATINGNEFGVKEIA